MFVCFFIFPPLSQKIIPDKLTFTTSTAVAVTTSHHLYVISFIDSFISKDDQYGLNNDLDLMTFSTVPVQNDYIVILCLND